MDKLSNTKCGFTLVEVLVSVGIMAVLLPFVAHMLTNSQLLASYAKHKIQAAYAAQQIIETQRQEPLSYFAPMLAVQKPSADSTSWQVALDTKGNYANPTCANPNVFCGVAVVTVTPEIYTNTAGQTTNYTAIYTPSVGAPYNYYTIAHVGVQISWMEQIVFQKVLMNEFYAADIIVNDPMLN